MTSRDITTSAVADVYPTWSPTGKEIAFVSPKGTGQDRIFVIKPDGTAERPVSPPGVGVIRQTFRTMSWSPDGKQIAFVGQKGTSLQLAIIDVQGNKQPAWITSGSIPPEKPLWFESKIHFFRGDSLYAYETTTNKTTNLGTFLSQSPFSDLDANATHVYFSYQPQATGASPDHLVRVQRFTHSVDDLGRGRFPDVCPASAWAEGYVLFEGTARASYQQFSSRRLALQHDALSSQIG